ncbi:phospholipid phosphatase 1 isoform X3 [Coregonus clupeaformis]|uniref:phospholipid phosphatase 1 isoform X3 n=1 Tax=Coregonus clupeaformis TaxID=59861 RepID=UPI001BE05D70|nr:phospholipid phosphatase 1 isoform X3 [Coregonus clupeaformis]
MFEMRGIPFILLDVACLILVGLPLAALKLGQIKPYQRGFFCNDDSISYPFHHSTITSNVLYGLGFTLPICSMVFGECLSVYLKRIKSKSSFSNMYVACVYKAIGTFVFGAAMSQSLTDIAKYSIGRLRPHFLDVCKPDWKLINCTAGTYIEDFTCTGNARMANEGRQVFVLLMTTIPKKTPRAGPEPGKGCHGRPEPHPGCPSTLATPPSPCTACCSWHCTSRPGCRQSGPDC